MNEDQEPVGSVTEEASKLLQALRGWAEESGTDYAAAASGAATHAAAAVDGLNAHIATGSEDCRYCPVCQVISAVRGTSPEVKDHLTSAAASLMAAIAGVMETKIPGRPDPAPDPSSRRSPVQKIDLSDGSDGKGDV